MPGNLYCYVHILLGMKSVQQSHMHVIKAWECSKICDLHISQNLMFCSSEESNFAESEMSQGSKEHLDEGTEASTEELRVLQDEVILPADKQTMPMGCATRKSWMAIRVEGGPIAAHQLWEQAESSPRVYSLAKVNIRAHQNLITSYMHAGHQFCKMPRVLDMGISLSC